MTRYEQIIENLASSFFGFWYAHRVGILGTIAVNMLLAVVFMLTEMQSHAHLYESYMQIDFEREFTLNPPEKIEKEPNEAPEKHPDPEQYEAVRNVAVDATSTELNPGLTDEKALDAEEIYREAARVREQMQANRQKWDEAQQTLEPNVPNTPEKNTAPAETGKYQGPAVISYYLLGRKALYLPVPAYKCEAGGQVVVDIEVNPNGTVGRATIDQSRSVADDCITQAALRAANDSRFSASSASSNRQRGSITYLFVPQ